MIKMTFKKGGLVTMEPTGYPGQACQRVTGQYRKHMTGDVIRDVATAEGSEPEEVERVGGSAEARKDLV